MVLPCCDVRPATGNNMHTKLGGQRSAGSCLKCTSYHASSLFYTAVRMRRCIDEQQVLQQALARIFGPQGTSSTLAGQPKAGRPRTLVDGLGRSPPHWVSGAPRSLSACKREVRWVELERER